ncbi:hypothetical protein PIB30_041860 [Stylosanthes scabra]|uniref:Secreted protein n=1 Tax=Stylosanthes scabra TaxID=79078 RepID=A0ABU6UDP0_9FABA|nr:hypothetical protein [Stylosanthes scabra]
MRLLKRTPIIRMACSFLVVLLDRSCHYRVFWLINDEHVRSMFASHGRILTYQPVTGPSTPGSRPHKHAVVTLMTTILMEVWSYWSDTCFALKRQYTSVKNYNIRRATKYKVLE